jgi:hypothetical protein
MASPGGCVLDELRQASAWIADQSTLVRVVEDRIAAYAARLSVRSDQPDDPGSEMDADVKCRLRFV